MNAQLAARQIQTLFVVALLATSACSGSPQNFVPAQNPALQAIGAHFIRVAPTSLSFYATTSPQYVKVSDRGAGGLITVTSNNTAVATVSPSSIKSGTKFSVTPVGGGSTTISVTDPQGRHSTVKVKVIP